MSILMFVSNITFICRQSRFEENNKTHYISKSVDHDDWQLDANIFWQLAIDYLWGPQTVDRFADVQLQHSAILQLVLIVIVSSGILVQKLLTHSPGLGWRKQLVGSPIVLGLLHTHWCMQSSGALWECQQILSENQSHSGHLFVLMEDTLATSFVNNWCEIPL